MKAERIVYVLGAGFSAPLGLPVMSDFLLRSKDIYAADQKRYSHFARVFGTIDQMARAKNYFSVDLFNIEEILSILDMEDYVGGRRHRKAFTQYIADVIDHFTPVFRPQDTPQSIHQDMFTTDPKGNIYCTCVCNLFRASISATDATHCYEISRRLDGSPTYGIVSLNYDAVLERAVAAVNRVCTQGQRLAFTTSLEEYVADESAVALAKIHGSTDPLTIVPPTWRKAASKQVQDAWRLAHRLLSQATQIRVLGYSLPTTDTYIRYLLMNAATNAEHLKNIDIFCLDKPQGRVKARYDDFISYFRMRFSHMDVEYYMSAAHGEIRVRNVGGFAQMHLDVLERCHEARAGTYGG